MIDATTAVWIAPNAEARADSGDGPGAPQLLEWARARGVKLVAPTEERAAELAVDWNAGDRVEALLARAHDALVAVDMDATERALAEAELALRDHPELPQAAWLRAEVERGWAARWLRDPATKSASDERAARAWARATGLDGGRAPGLGERAFDGPAPVAVTIAVDGEARGASVLRVDGAQVDPGPVTRAAGDHQVTVIGAYGVATTARWVAFDAGATLHFTRALPPPCSREDVEVARIDGGDRVDARGVRCPRWVAVRAIGGRALRVATCEGEACGPLVEWRTGLALDPALPAESARDHARGLPTWATLVLAGATIGAAALAAVVITSAVKPAPTETRFVSGGVQIHSF